MTDGSQLVMPSRDHSPGKMHQLVHHLVGFQLENVQLGKLGKDSLSDFWWLGASELEPGVTNGSEMVGTFTVLVGD